MGSFNPTAADLKGTVGLSKEKKIAKAKGKTKQELKAKAEVKLTQAQILAKVASGEMTPEQAGSLLGASRGTLHCKSNPNLGNVSLYGLQRMPVSLYVNQWERLLTGCDRKTHPVLMFIDEHSKYLCKNKGESFEQPPKELIGEGKPFRVPVQREEAE